MHRFALLSFLPAVLGCLDLKSNACASYISNNLATASACCATFTKSAVTATTGLLECSCYFTGGAASPTSIAKFTTTTLATTTTKITVAPSGVTKTLPKSSGAVPTLKAITIPAGQTFDSSMKNYDRSPWVCAEQDEKGDEDSMSILGGGVHCRGQCTLINVWWEDICEDTVTFKQSKGTSNIIGGGAFHASDTVTQFNGFETVNIKSFYVKDYGNVASSCGNCKTNGGAHHFVMDNIVAVDRGVLCGINTNYGGTCAIINSCQDDGKSCDRFTGNSGKEATKIGSGPDGTYCEVSGLTETS
ncbi:hypothetical protein VTI74DRAFT_3441 [Chaetomium olivicolor]